MALRVLSGILITKGHQYGESIIHLRDHKVTGTVTRVVKKQEVGPPGDFKSPPCRIVSLREIKVKADMDFQGAADIDFFRLNDSVVSNEYLKIEWNATGGSEIQEISYLIIGEV